mmetsp:Transcript_14095/g.30641  ORF Transcript_14095/g.30641 Transcript_14095/m.30641 type:complete len:763 (+) Transcript_14095:89-2377(+)
MWGRISNLAEKIDSNFATEDANNDGSQEEGSDFGGQAAVDGDGGATPTSGEEESGAALVDDEEDGDGWDDDDGFGDDFDFADEQPEPIENGVGGLPPFVEDHDQTLDKENEADIDNTTARDNGLGDVVENVTVVKAEDVADTITAIKDAAPESDAMSVEDESAEVLEEVVQPVPPIIPPPPLAQSPPPQTNDHYPNIVTVSAPGKALIAGGYLVLESPNPGVVLAAEGCRFHTTITFRPPYSEGGVIGNSVDATWESIPLDVYSPQFDRVFSYYLSYSLLSNDVEEGVSLRLQPRTGPHEPNKFVERSLLLALGYLRQSLGANEFHARLQRREQGDFNAGERVALAIKLRADNDFYSQITRLREEGLDLTPHNLERLDQFLPCPKDELTGEVVVNKTGMGSSAALVTSIVGALLRFFGVISLPGMDGEGDEILNDVDNKTNGDGGIENEGLRIAHNLSQICHCHAQGKVGSGFDVSSAIYGSHIYTRFSKGVINEFLESVASLTKGEEDGLQLSESLSNQLVRLVNDVEWDCTVRPISLPPGLELLMADVCGGSESPSMARKILDWKKNKRRVGFMDDYYWKDLKRCNKRIVSLLSDQFTSQTFLDGLQRDGAMIISTRTAEQWKKPMPSSWYKFEGSSWDVALKLLDLRMAFVESRQNLKGMGKAAGVPVEPDEQSALADATMKLPGVVAAGVPGAGGYDALFAIYVKGPETNDGKSDRVRDEIGNLWREMSDENNETVVCPLSVKAAASGGGLCSTKLDW